MNFWQWDLHLDAVPLRASGAHREGDVAHHGEPRHERVTLEHHATVERRPGDFAPVHDDRAGRGRVQAGEDVQDRGLAAAGMADDADELAFLHAEVHALEDVGVIEAFGQALDLEERHRV